MHIYEMISFFIDINTVRKTVLFCINNVFIYQGNVKELFGYTNGVSSLIPLIQHEKLFLYKRVICTNFT